MGVLIATWVAATAAGSKSDLDNRSYLIRGISQGAMGPNTHSPSVVCPVSANYDIASGVRLVAGWMEGWCLRRGRMMMVRKGRFTGGMMHCSS